MSLTKPYFIVIAIVLLPFLAEAQLVKYGPSRTAPVKETVQESPNARRHAINRLDLPFWDDFSRVKGHTADSLLWINNDKVFINNGQAINPPTINVATFDGYNAEGLPYVTDPAVSGFGDTLESQPIRMADVDLSKRNDIFLSFFYQAGGNSEPPNQSDFLRLEFLDNEGNWTEIRTYYPGNNFDPSVFHEEAVQITDEKYFHNDFQFRFLFYGRLSGAYDSWHLDYVYLNERKATDRNTNISDRAMADPLTSVLGEYFSVPYKHFVTDPAAAFTKPSIELFNLKDTSFSQVTNYTARFAITGYTGGTANTITSGSTYGLPSLPSRERAVHQLQEIPDVSHFDPAADSANITVNVNFDSGDNTIDYFSRYIPINFMVNDTVEHTFTLSNYYAYDDGIAEYAAGLTQQGNEFAYRFIMKTNTADTLNGVYIYFPHFGGTAPTSTVLSIYKSKNGLPDSENTLYNQSIPIIQSANSKFEFFSLNEGIIVRDTFFIGYRETIAGNDVFNNPKRIRIGLDASHDTGHHMFYRSSELSVWRVNDGITGSFMIRPRFGKGEVITGADELQKPVMVYPNPTRGEFFMRGRVDQLQVISVTGQPVRYSSESFNDQQKITLHNATSGIYILRYRSGAKMFTEKILVRN